MPERKKFLLRLPSNVHGAVEKWAADDLRSVNAQIEYVLTEALRRAGRLKAEAASVSVGPSNEPDNRGE